MAKNQPHTGRVSDCNCSVRWHFDFRRILKDEEAEDLTTLLERSVYMLIKDTRRRLLERSGKLSVNSYFKSCFNIASMLYDYVFILVSWKHLSVPHETAT